MKNNESLRDSDARFRSSCEAAPEVTVEPAVPGGTETILLAEDDEGLRNLTSVVLDQLGYTVLLAEDGEEAVQMYTKNCEGIDLLLAQRFSN